MAFRRFCIFYERFVALNLNHDSELTLWERRGERQDPNTVPASALATSKVLDRVLYPSIAERLKIFATLPVTTCKSERNVSALRRNRH